jgi:large subunit ribosomal protein L4
VVSQFVSGDSPSTKDALAVLGDWKDEGRVLVVLSREEESAWRSLRNVAALSLVSPDQLNAYDAVVSDRIVFTEAGLADFVGKGKKPEEES